MVNLFQIVPEDFFKPLTSKYNDKEIIVAELENYFDSESSSEMVFDEDDNEVAIDSRAKANAIIRRLKDSGWIEYELANDFKVKVNLSNISSNVLVRIPKN